jgi:uncharacterized protein (TIGR03083 family)
MDYAQHIDAAEYHAELFAAAIAAGPLDARVPTCPDWTVRDITEHVGGFTPFWAHVLCDATGRPKFETTPMPDGSPAEVADWYRGLAAHLVEELRATDPDATTWTWVPDQQNAAFIGRRCAHELAVHRHDIESSRGTPEVIAPVLAADGIDEIFVMIRAWSDGNGGRGQGETLHLHGSEGDEWLITLAPDGLQVDHSHAKADAALRGRVADLEMVLYSREPIEPVEQFGDDAVLDAWKVAFTFG